MTTMKVAACSAIASCLHESYQIWGWQGVLAASFIIATATWLFRRRLRHDARTSS